MATPTVNSGPRVSDTIKEMNAMLEKQQAMTKASNQFSVATSMIKGRGEAMNKGAANLVLQR